MQKISGQMCPGPPVHAGLNECVLNASWWTFTLLVFIDQIPQDAFENQV